MQKLSQGKSFEISNIYFENNSYELQDAVKEVLVEFASYLELNSTLLIEVNGFTDNVGNMQDNQLLSENRSKAVRDFILKQGVSKERVLYNGYGESFPVSSNKTKKGRSKNRRTEFKIISR